MEYFLSLWSNVYNLTLLATHIREQTKRSMSLIEKTNLNDPPNIVYYPWFDITIFSLTLFGSVIAYLTSVTNFWGLITLIFFSYAITLSQAQIIKLTLEKLNIISFNPFFRSRSINTKSIIGIKSSESYEYDTVVTAEAYSIFKRSYNLEYLDKKGRKKNISIRINNERKERQILTTIKSITGL